MQIQISRGGVLHTEEYGKIGKDVTENACAYLNCPVIFTEDGVTVGDIYDLLAKNPVLMSVYERNFVHSFIEYLADIPVKKRLALYQKEQKKPNAIEYVELYRHYHSDDVNQTLDLFNCGLMQVHGMSKVLTRAYDGYKKGQRINYSLTGVDVARLYHMPVKYNDKALVTQENHYSARPVDRREYSHLREFIVPVITLNELIESVTWELSFHGSPKSNKEFVEELRSRVKDSHEQNDFSEDANKVVKAVRKAYDDYENMELIKLFKEVKGDAQNAQEFGKQAIEMLGIELSKTVKGSKNESIVQKVAGYTMHLVLDEEKYNELDVDYIIKLAQENLNEKEYTVKQFTTIVELVNAKLKDDTPKDEAHAERNQIVVNKIAQTEKEIAEDSILLKDLKFIVNELEDLIEEIEKGYVREIFIHIDRINKQLNSDSHKRYEENLYGFKKLPELDEAKLKKLSRLIECLPNDVSMDTVTDVMFQNTAELIDEVKGLTAYEYRIKRLLYKPCRGLFSVHENKALERKENESHKRYAEKQYQENQMTEKALEIVENNRSIFINDDESAIKGTHKIVVEIRPDVSLLRWKTVLPKKVKSKKKKK